MPVSMRRRLHFTAADLLYFSGGLDAWRFLRNAVLRKQESLVLGLHRVLSPDEQARSNSLDGMALSEATFAKLLEHVEQRFDVVSLQDFLEGNEAERAGKPRCLLTFDDGWGDTYRTAFRWLKKFGMPAVVFLAAGSMEGKNGFWVEQVNAAFKAPARRAHLEAVLNEVVRRNGMQRDARDVVEWLKHMPAKLRESILERLLFSGQPPGAAAQTNGVDCMMTWDEAAEMTGEGIEMGAHTVTHPLLTYEDDATASRELQLGKQILEDKLRSRVRAFAYPNGDWDERIRRQTQQAGYACAFTTHPGWYRPGQDRYTIPRVLLHEGNVTGRDGQFSPAMFHLALAGRA